MTQQPINTVHFPVGPIVLDPLPFRIGTERLLDALHLRAGSAQAGAVNGMVQEAYAIARPKAVYKIGYIDSRGSDHVIIDGVRFASRVLAVNLSNAQRVFAHISTAGRELAGWAQSQDDLLASYYADAINEAVLYGARATLDKILRSRHEVTKVAEMNPGSLEDWPLREQRPLFELMGGTSTTIGVELTKSYLMVPAKSVSGLVFPTEETFASCQLCPRMTCPNRRAPYDPELFARKYRDPATVA